MVNAHREQPRGLFAGTLSAIEAVFGARKLATRFAKGPDGKRKLEFVELGPVKTVTSPA